MERRRPEGLDSDYPSGFRRQKLKSTYLDFQGDLRLVGGINIPIHFEPEGLGKLQLEARSRVGIHLRTPLVTPLPRPVEQEQPPEGLRVTDEAGVEGSVLNRGTGGDGETSSEVLPICNRQHEGLIGSGVPRIVFQRHGETGEAKKLLDRRGFVEEFAPKEPGPFCSVDHRYIEPEADDIQEESLVP